VDILEKKGDLIKIIEVKSASCKGSDESQFTTGRALKKREYLEDIAFQYLVCLEAFPEYKIAPYLMVDKNIECSIDGLYSQFVIRKEERLYSNNKLSDGGAAMTAWAFMQFAEMKDEGMG